MTGGVHGLVVTGGVHGLAAPAESVFITCAAMADGEDQTSKLQTRPVFSGAVRPNAIRGKKV